MSVTVDEILQRMIVDAKNFNPTINITQGTDTYIRFACAASAIWGLYKQTDWTLNQIFPTSMSVESLKRFAADRGQNVEGLTPSELLTFILSYIRKPASGGKPFDFERWALEATSVGKTVELQESMISGDVYELQASELLNPHVDTVGFELRTSDVEKYIVVDLGDPTPLIGVGLGFSTSRKAVLNVYGGDGEDAFIKIGEVDVAHGWCQLNFSKLEVSKLKIELQYIDGLEDWQQEALNHIKCTGLEIYGESDDVEAAATAKCLKNHNGVGTAMILVTPLNLSMRCCEAIRAKCEEEGPVAPREIYVNVPEEITVDLRIAVSGLPSLDIESFTQSVKKYFAELSPGKTLIPAQIVVLAIQNGATFARVYGSFNGSGEEELTDIVTCKETEVFTLGEMVVE